MKITNQSVGLARLKPGPYQKREVFEAQALLELAESIYNDGVINPLLVARNGSGYQIIAGERRWRASAAVALWKRGLGETLAAAVSVVTGPEGPAAITGSPFLRGCTVEVRVASGEAADLHTAAVIDNHQRANLNPIEEAQDFAGLMEQYGWSIAETSRRVGKSDAHVRSRLIWLELEPEIQELVASGALAKSTEVASALLGVPAEARIGLAKRFVARRTSVRGISAACRRTAALMKEAKKKPEPVAAKARPVVARPERVPIQQVAVQAVEEVPVTVAPMCLCDGCRETIANLAEELCGECSANGLSEQCLMCPGLIEIVDRLVGAARC